MARRCVLVFVLGFLLCSHDLRAQEARHYQADPAKDRLLIGGFSVADEQGLPPGWRLSGRADRVSAADGRLRLEGVPGDPPLRLVTRLPIQPDWQWLTLAVRLRAPAVTLGDSPLAEATVRFAAADAQGTVRRLLAAIQPPAAGAHRDWVRTLRTVRREVGDELLVIEISLADAVGAVEVDDVVVIPSDPSAEFDPRLVNDLLDAIRRGDASRVRQVLGMNPTLVEARSDRYDSGTPLIAAAWEGQADIVELLLEAGARRDAVDRNLKMPAIGWAAFWGRHSVVDVLLHAGADPNSMGASGRTPLAWMQTALKLRRVNGATVHDYAQVAELLQARGGHR